MVTTTVELPYRHGRYVLLREISRGGMAVVYHGKSIGEGGFSKDVAVKRMLPQQDNDQQFLAMLIDEARVLTQLQHPNIVQVLELGLDADAYFLAMEYIAGFDLRTLVERLRVDRVKLPERFVYFIVLEILQGLVCAHTRVDATGKTMGIVHRDISPHNVLVSLQGEVKIADFGIAKGAHRNWETTVEQVKGKFSYMAPEQARGEPLDRRADLFAAGIILFELLTGDQLFDGANDLAVLEQVRTAQLPKGWERKIHPGVRTIVRTALACDVSERYPTAAQFYAELAQFVTQQQLTTTRVDFSGFLQMLFPADVLRHQQVCGQEIPADVLKSVGIVPVEPVESGTKVYDAGTLRQLRTGGASVVRTLHLSVLGVLVTLSLGMSFPGDRARASALVSRTIPAPAVPLATGRVPPPVPLQPIAVPGTSAAVVAVTPIARPISGAAFVSAAQSASVTEPAAKGRIVVNARPWGYVTIPGLLARKETPVSIPAAAGQYTVRITSGDGASVAARAVVKPGQTATCQAVLGAEAKASCR